MEAFRAIAISCPALRSLSLADCHQLPFAFVKLAENIATFCEQLEHLNLAGYWDLSDYIVFMILQSHRNLRWLSLARAFEITDKAVEYIYISCKQIEYLDLEGCWQITDKSLG